MTAFMREQIAQLTADNRWARPATTRARSAVFRAFSAAANCLSPRSPSGWSRSTTLTCCAAGSSGTPCRSTCASCARFTTRRSAGGWPSRRRRSAGVYTGVDRTRKRAIDERLIARLKSLDLPVSGALPLARDLFVFSYCMRGMAFVDMAFLRKKDMRDGAIHYVRRKTGQRMTVHLEPCMREIIGRYAPRTRDTPYLFPVLTAEDPARAYAQYQVALNYYNRLRKSSRRAGAGLRAFVLHLASQLGDGGPQPQCAAAGDQRRNGAHLRAHDADLPLGAGNLGHRLRQPENPRFAEPLRLLLTCPEMRV